MKKILFLSVALTAVFANEPATSESTKLVEKSNMAGFSAGIALSGNQSDDIGLKLNTAYTIVSGPLYLGIEDEFKLDGKPKTYDNTK
jgi:hypothetical protein